VPRHNFATFRSSIATTPPPLAASNPFPSEYGPSVQRRRSVLRCDVGLQRGVLCYPFEPARLSAERWPRLQQRVLGCMAPVNSLPGAESAGPSLTSAKGAGAPISDEASKEPSDSGSAARASSQKPWLETTPTQLVALDLSLAAQRQLHF
jgi:hypothetical protein